MATQAYDGPSPAETDKADDAAYANDFATLVAVFRTQIAGLNTHLSPSTRFAGELRHIAHLMLDGWGASDAQFPQQCFDDHGPQMILRALARAYEAPAHVLGELEGD